MNDDWLDASFVGPAAGIFPPDVFIESMRESALVLEPRQSGNGADDAMVVEDDIFRNSLLAEEPLDTGDDFDVDFDFQGTY